MKKLAVFPALLLAGCSTGEIVHLTNGTKAASCGPYTGYGVAEEQIAAQQLRDCVSDFQRQGYERVVAPAK